MEVNVISQMMDLFYKKYLIPLTLVDRNFIPLYSSMEIYTETTLQDFLVNVSIDHSVVLLSNSTNLFGYFSFKSKNEEDYTLFIGPCGTMNPAGSSHLYNKQTSKITYPVVDKQTFEDFIILIYSSFTHEKLDRENISWIHNEKELFPSLHIDRELNKNLYNRRHMDKNFDYYQLELRYFDYIKRNQPEKIDWLFEKMKEVYHGNLASGKLENLKYKLVAAVAIATRILIDKGVPINQAFSLSDASIHGLEYVLSVDAWFVYMKEVTFRFMKLLHNHSYSGKSLIVKTVINYIDGHIYEKIPIERLSTITQKHRSYLSIHFKDETGQTLHSYIQERKIREAEHLLVFTNQSYKEISTLLSFSSQSHFISVFKKISGTTPKDFREQNAHMT